MKRAMLILAAAFALYIAVRPYEAEHFSPDEFGQWHGLLAPRLLPALDAFRAMWDAPVFISRATGAVGRRLGEDNGSWHNIDAHGAVYAVDVMPSGMDTLERMQRAIEIARMVGFTGIGLYPDWKPAPGLHLDVRPTRAVGDPAVWGFLDDENGNQGGQLGLAAVLSAVQRRERAA